MGEEKIAFLFVKAGEESDVTSRDVVFLECAFCGGVIALSERTLLTMPSRADGFVVAHDECAKQRKPPSGKRALVAPS